MFRSTCLLDARKAVLLLSLTIVLYKQIMFSIMTDSTKVMSHKANTELFLSDLRHWEPQSRLRDWPSEVVLAWGPVTRLPTHLGQDGDVMIKSHKGWHSSLQSLYNSASAKYPSIYRISNFHPTYIKQDKLQRTLATQLHLSNVSSIFTAFGLSLFFPSLVFLLLYFPFSRFKLDSTRISHKRISQWNWGV